MKEDREDIHSARCRECKAAEEGDDDGDNRIQGPKENRCATQEFDEGKFQHRWNGGYNHGYFPSFPRIITYVSKEYGFTRRKEDRIPQKVLAQSLLDYDAE